MKTKHTPGPWLFTGISGVLYIVSKYNPYAFIARVMFTPGLGRQCYKNSQLMEAAPDLLEACQEVKNLANGLLDYGEIDQEIAGELLLIVNPIIKKAGAE